MLRTVFEQTNGLGPDQEVNFFYTRYHLSSIQSCALFGSTNFGLIWYLNSAQNNLFLELCCALKNYLNLINGFFVNALTVLWIFNYWIFHKCKILFSFFKTVLSIWALKKELCVNMFCFCFCVNAKRFVIKKSFCI